MGRTGRRRPRRTIRALVRRAPFHHPGCPRWASNPPVSRRMCQPNRGRSYLPRSWLCLLLGRGARLIAVHFAVVALKDAIDPTTPSAAELHVPTVSVVDHHVSRRVIRLAHSALPFVIV